MNYYDGNTVTGAVELRPALRDERQLLRHHLRAVVARRDQPGRPGNTGGVDMAHTANNPTIATATTPNADLTPDGTGGYSLTNDAQPYWDDCSTRDAVALSGTTSATSSTRPACRGAGSKAVSGRPPRSPTPPPPSATPASRPRPSSRTSSTAAGLNSSVPHSSNQGLCNAVHPVGAGLAAPLTPGTGQYGYKDDYIPHHEPFEYYASTANPHHLTLPMPPTARSRRTRCAPSAPTRSTT